MGIEKYGDTWNKDDIRQHVADTMASGKVIPGYGHAVLRKTDPRFICELEFANEFIKGSNLTQHDYYTVLFGVSRAFGVSSGQVWSRALGMPIERPNSYDLEHLIAMTKK